MLDTIEMLEAIGSDASLRYASTEELTVALDQVRATKALSSAVAHNDASYLAQEHGDNRMYLPQAIQTFS
jgi:hypothetical protein